MKLLKKLREWLYLEILRLTAIGRDVSIIWSHSKYNHIDDACVFLKDGEEVSGKLVDINRYHAGLYGRVVLDYIRPCSCEDTPICFEVPISEIGMF